MLLDHLTYLPVQTFEKTYGAMELLELLDQNFLAYFGNRVDGAIVCPRGGRGGSGYPFPSTEKTARVIRGHERLMLQVWVNPLVEGVDRQIEIAANEYGARDIKLMPSSHYYRVESEITHPVMEKARQMRLVVTVHSGTANAMPLEIKELAETFPDVPIVMEHMGYRHYEPGWGATQSIDLVAKRLENVYLDTAEVFNHRVIRHAVKSLGAEKVIFASEAPLLHPALGIQAVKLAQLTKEEEELVMGGLLQSCTRYRGTEGNVHPSYVGDDKTAE